MPFYFFIKIKYRLKYRKSYRKRGSHPNAIEKITVFSLIFALFASSAASAINQQPWFFVALTDQELMSEISGSGMSFTPPAGAGGNTGDAPDAPADAAAG